VFSYRIDDLLRHTSGWDDDLVSAVETEASEYRRQAHYLADMLVTLGRLQRLAQAQTSDKPAEDTP
jgi:CubicO group peptidase (beta-lactamase class C family)